MVTVDIRPTEIRCGDRLHCARHRTASVTEVVNVEDGDTYVRLDDSYYVTLIPGYAIVTVDRED